MKKVIIIAILFLFVFGCTSQNNNVNESEEKIISEPIQTFSCPDGSIVTNLSDCPKCPPSCDDKNPCTLDTCDINTGYKCYNQKISGPTVGCSGNLPECKENICSDGVCIEQDKSPCCGNNIVEEGETCSNCPDDIICESSTICCSDTCIKPICIEDLDCEDKNMLTIDKCLEPNTCNAKCSNLVGQCEDGTNYMECSINTPLYCTNLGRLILKASECGCSNYTSPYVVVVAGDECRLMYWANNGKSVTIPEGSYSGAMRVTINSIKITKPDSKETQTLEVNLKAQNIGNQDASIYCWTGMYVIDRQEREYKGETNYKGVESFGDNLNPGLYTSGTCTFKIPSSIKPYAIVFKPLFGEAAQYYIIP